MQSVGFGSLRSLNPLRVAHLGLLLSAFVPASTFPLAPRMVCGGIVVVGPDGVPRPGRPYVIPETPPTGDGSPLYALSTRFPESEALCTSSAARLGDGTQQRQSSGFLMLPIITCSHDVMR